VRLNIGIVDGLSERPGEIVDVYVEDNGRGIAPDELGRVFGMFQRGSSAGSDAEGLGIGLAVVQRIAELHGGRVRVVSEVGQGSRFTVSLPLYQSSLS
jgi:signal transduction histidine kinase